MRQCCHSSVLAKRVAELTSTLSNLAWVEGTDPPVCGPRAEHSRMVDTVGPELRLSVRVACLFGNSVFRLVYEALCRCIQSGVQRSMHGDRPGPIVMKEKSWIFLCLVLRWLSCIPGLYLREIGLMGSVIVQIRYGPCVPRWFLVSHWLEVPIVLDCTS